MDNHWPGNRCSWSHEERLKSLLNPAHPSLIGLFGSRKILEKTNRSHGVIGCIDYIVGHKALDITDNWNRSFLDPARQLFSHSGFCLTLTDRSVHGSLPSTRCHNYALKLLQQLLRLFQIARVESFREPPVNRS